jgi:hypothetical protein
MPWQTVLPPDPVVALEPEFPAVPPAELLEVPSLEEALLEGEFVAFPRPPPPSPWRVALPPQAPSRKQRTIVTAPDRIRQSLRQLPASCKTRGRDPHKRGQRRAAGQAPHFGILRLPKNPSGRASSSQRAEGVTTHEEDAPRAQ